MIEDLEDIEIWESTTDSAVWLWLLDPIAGRGAWKHQQVGGQNGNRRIQMTVRERRYNQDRIDSRNAQFDPFLNGLLICRQGKTQSPRAYTDAQLIELLNISSDQDEAFETVARGLLQYEVVVRRLLGLAERNAPSYRRDLLEGLIDETYRVGWTQRSQRTDLPEKGVGNGVLISS